MGLVKLGKRKIQVWGFDTETIKGQPYTFQLSYGNKKIFYEKRFTTKEFRNAFLETLFKECETGAVIFSYNLYFEIVCLFRDWIEILSKNKFKYFGKDFFIEGMLENPTPRMVICGRNKIFYVVDASKFFSKDRGVKSLDEVSKAFLTVPKMKRPKYLGERKPKRGEKKYFEKYSMVDAYLVEILGEKIIGFHNLVNIEEITFSISQLAGKAFIKNYTNGKGLDVARDDIEEFCDNARFGGYRACHIDSGVYRDMVHLDLDSAYPYAMSIIPSFYKGKYVSTHSLNEFGVYRIKTILPENDRPYFQQKRYVGKSYKLEFIPQGVEVIFYVTGFEIINFKSVFKNWKYKILDGFIWKGQNNYKPLAQWVKDMHKNKLSISKDDKKRKAEREVYKLFMNTISGKADNVIFERDEIWITKEGILERGKKHFGIMKNFFIATLIRAIPRSIAWKTGLLTGSLFEVTDSISIPRKNLKIIKKQLGKGLGKWGFEVGKNKKTDLVFERLGTYFYFDSRKKLKSEPLKIALQGFHGTWKTYFKLLFRKAGKEQKYKKLRMNKLRESLRQQKPEKVLTFEKKTFKKIFDQKFQSEVKKWVGKK